MNWVSFLYCTGDIPHSRLKNLPKADWSLKLSISATCCTERDGLRRLTLASRTSIAVRMLPAVCPRVRFVVPSLFIVFQAIEERVMPRRVYEYFLH